MNIDVSTIVEQHALIPPALRYEFYANVAGYDGYHHALILDVPRMTDPGTLALMGMYPRFPAAVRSRLDRVRWIVAHEMGHAVQRRGKTLAEWRQMVEANQSQIQVTGRHTGGWLEADADRFAHDNWRHVRINGHGPRSAAR